MSPNVLLVCNFIQELSTYFGLFTGLIALIAFVLYFFHPRFAICVCYNDSQIRITVKNNNVINLCNKKIVDIKCEATLAETEDFSNEVITLEMMKDWIICLNKKPANYVFKTTNANIKDKNYLRVRLLASNFIGVKKVTEEYYTITKKGDSCYFNNQKTK